MNCSVETPSQENEDDVNSNQKSQQNTMFIIFRELFFLFAVIFIAYATLYNAQTKTKRGTPQPFFHHPYIKDFYLGDLSQLMDEVTYVDFSFVMFYAPWDADCQDTKKEFIEAAEFYTDKVYFAAVNCWEPGSECRSTFKDLVYHFPQLVAYIGPRKAVEYKGVHLADHIIRFIQSIIFPIVKLGLPSDLWQLRYFHDAVLVGHEKFQGRKGGIAYKVLLDTSLRLATHDYMRHTIVAVFTNSIYNQVLGVKQNPAIVLYLWNRKVEYKGELNVNSLHKWILKHVDKGLADLNSNTLLPHVKQGAVMVMFTPRHPLSTVIPYYHLLKRIVLNFNSCGNITHNYSEEELISYVLHYSSTFPPAYDEEYHKSEMITRKDCLKYMKNQKIQTRCVMPSATKWDNVTCNNLDLSYCPLLTLRNPEGFPLGRNKWLKFGTTEELIEAAKWEKCALLERTPTPFFPALTPNITKTPSSCEINSTLSFIALDSNLYSHLANALGIQLGKMKHSTSVVIFNNEEVLKLNGTEVSERSITNMLKLYISGERNRSLRSMKDIIYFHTSPKELQKSSNSVSIQELNTFTFHNIVFNASKNVIVLYHSPYCSFCLGVSNLFLTLAHLLKNIENLAFARIDGELNDLPWQYSVHSYPSILFFPSHRKTESRIFSHHLHPTLHTLSNFILSNLRPYERIPVMLALCSRWGQNPFNTKEGEHCLQEVRSSFLEAISSTLREYRSNLLRLKFNQNTSLEQHLKQRQRRLLCHLEYFKIAQLHLARIQDIQRSVITLNSLQLEMT